MEPPIVLVWDNQISIYPSIDLIPFIIEKADTYGLTMYDSNGILLEFKYLPIEIERKFLFFKWKEQMEIMEITESKIRSSFSEELKERVFKYLKLLGYLNDESINIFSLKDLINKLDLIENKRWRWKKKK